MSTLYAFINQTQYDAWSTQKSGASPSVEGFLRDVGTVRIRYSNDVLVAPFVAVKSGGCVNIIQKYPELNTITDVQPELNTIADVQPELNTIADVQPELNTIADVQPITTQIPQTHGILCRIKKFLRLKKN